MRTVSNPCKLKPLPMPYPFQVEINFPVFGWQKCQKCATLAEARKICALTDWESRIVKLRTAKT